MIRLNDIRHITQIQIIQFIVYNNTQILITSEREMQNQIVKHLMINLSADDRRKYLNEQTTRILNNDECWDFVRKLNEKHVEIFNMIHKDVPISQFRLSSNKRPHIIRQISSLNLHGLMLLDIGSSSITSIEELCRVRMPNLQRLNLYNNLITNYSPLRKCHFPNLIYLTTQSNPSTNSLMCMSQVQLKNMLWLWVEHKDKQSAMSQSVLWLIKTNMPKLAECIIKSRYRVNKQCLMEQVQKKYRSTSFKTS